VTNLDEASLHQSTSGIEAENAGSELGTLEGMMKTVKSTADKALTVAI
jgi:hypothetical protein